jgi:protein-disulfide isomerase
VDPASAPVANVAAGAGPRATGEEDAAVPIDARNPTWGSRTAPVTIVEFADFQCGFCRMVEPTLAKLRATYGPETLRIVWKNAPLEFHPEAHPAAEVGAGVMALAGNEAFWKYHDAVFANQADMGVDHYYAWAKEAGVADAKALRSGLESRAWAQSVDADLREGAGIGVQGTPTFFVDGVEIVGAQPYEAFQAIVDDELKAARAKLAAGTPADRVYAELAKENRAAAPKDPAADEEVEDTKTVFKVPIGASPVRGGPNALVTIVEFADYQCPYCGRAEDTMKALREKYRDKLRFVFKDAPLPFHEHAEPAAEATLQVREEKGDTAFWLMHDALFAGQDSLDEETLVRVAATLGARTDRVRTAIEKHTHQRSIDADLELADDLSAEGTPHFFIDGRRLVGAQPIEKFVAIIDEEIGKAQKLVAAGTKPADVYQALTKDGQGAPPPETKDLPASLPASDPSRGPASAKVVVHEWSDFQCPFCARVEPTVQRLLKEYPTQVRLVWHDLPLPMHPNAPGAAQAAREAMAQKGQKAFWTMHDRFFDHQKDLGRDNLDAWARALGLDMTKWGAALDGASHADAIDADAKAADAMGINGTPGFVIVPAGKKSGYFLAGAQPYPRFRKLVERALAEAK